MFSGIIKNIGVLENKIQQGGGLTITINSKEIADTSNLGDSIAVNGVCLTIVKITGYNIEFNISPTTNQISLFKNYPLTTKLNLERAISLNTLLSGHIVQGHIDGVAKVIEIVKKDQYYLFKFKFDSKLDKFISNKCSITIDGISLTVSNMEEAKVVENKEVNIVKEEGEEGKNESIFNITIVPYTFDNTNLKYIKKSDLVHIETDIISRYLDKLIRK